MKYFGQSGLLQRFYFSHKLKPDYGIPKLAAKNKWLKAYLYALHSMTLGDRSQAFMLPIYNSVWESAVLKDWLKSDVAHVLLQGTALKLIERCREEGTYVIGEAVNAHPNAANVILASEHERLGLEYVRFDKIWDRMKQEYDRSQCILVPSNWVERSFLQAGFSPEKIQKLPYPSGFDGNQSGVKKGARAGRNVRVLCVASVQVRKGQHYLLEAVRQLNKQNARIQFEITLVGCVADKRYFSLLRKLGVPFDYIAHIPNKEMVGFMSAFDVFVLPSLEDGFGVVVGEALQAGIPVVTTQNAGAADAIVDGKNGFVVPAQDSRALANAIADALDVVPEFGFVAPDQIGDWQTYTERLISIYRASSVWELEAGEKGAHE